MRCRFIAVVLVVALTSSLVAQDKAKPKKAPPQRPTPTAADFVYGKDSERQKFDFWQAKSDRPTPLVLLIHGGGWVNGDKSSYGGNVIQPYLDQGISVASLNYRNLDEVPEFKGRNTTTEFLTKHVFDQLAKGARAGEFGREGRELKAIRVTLSESHVARAWYEAALW